MIAIDTNVLVRLLHDDKKATKQVEAARALERRIITADSRIFIPIIVLCETAWVLSFSYKVSQKQIMSIYQRFLENPFYKLEQPNLVEKAILRAKERGIDFVDALIAQSSNAAKCSTTYTFDKKACRNSDFTLLEA